MIAFFGKGEKQFDPINVAGWTWAAIGDSITSGVGVSTDAERYTELYAADKSMTMINLGESGQTLTTNEFRTGMKTKLGTAYGKQLITILAGSNDWTFGIPLGSTLNSDDSTIKSCTNYFIDQIRANSPESTILFILTTYRSVGFNVNSLGLTLLEYNEAIKEACIQRGVRYLNLYDVTGLEIVNVNTWTNDGSHPNTGGNSSMRDQLTNYFI